MGSDQVLWLKGNDFIDSGLRDAVEENLLGPRL